MGKMEINARGLTSEEIQTAIDQAARYRAKPKEFIAEAKAKVEQLLSEREKLKAVDITGLKIMEAE